MVTVTNLARFATRWRNLHTFNKEKITLVLSPHLDDIFLSLSATLMAGKLGKNIIGVNFFTASDSSVKTETATTFSSVTRISTTRMNEELAFSRILLSHGINYLPIFLGLKEASIDRYYSFIASAVMGRVHKRLGSKTPARGIYEQVAGSYARKLNPASALDPLLLQFKNSIRQIVAPISIGMNNLDHGIVAMSALKDFSAYDIGLYAEIPYMHLSGNMTLQKIHSMVPSSFGKVMLTKFDPKVKNGIFKRIYPSQYEERTTRAVSAIGRELGEVVVWRGSQA